MKKGIKTLALTMSLIVIAGALTSCNDDYTYPDNSWTEGKIVNVGGKDYNYKQIYDLMSEKKDSATAYYSTAKNILAQLVTPRTDAIIQKADSQMTTLEETWSSNAKTNGTSYKEEKEKTLSSENCIDEDALRNKKIAALQTEENSNAFYAETDGTTNTSDRFEISEAETKNFVEDERPYHVSHILVKVDAASGGTGSWAGQISSDDASQIGNVSKMLTSTSSFGSTAIALSDDSGSAASYGECTDSSSIPMQKSTSYISEFKMGLYAYDKYLNKKTSSTETQKSLSSSLRVPGTDGIEDETVAESIGDTEIAQKKAYGIPLSVCYTMGYLSDKEKGDTGTAVPYASTDQYPRNVLFNNYFNQHSVSFIYDDSSDYDANFLADVNKVQTANGKTVFGSIADVRSSGDYTVRMEQYDYVKGLLNSIDGDKFTAASDVLTDGYDLVSFKSTSDNNSSKTTYTTTVASVGTDKKILTDEKGDPIIVVRGGSSSYQGIHFIIVNHDPFYDETNDYRYWRVNLPSATKTDTSYTTDYNTDPSFVNFVKDDPSKGTLYGDRIKWVKATVKGYDTNTDFKLWESNLAAFKKANNNTDFLSLLPTSAATLITEYIDYTRAATNTTSNDSLDTSWEGYVNMLNLNQETQTRGIIPMDCVTYFESGSIPTNLEGAFHVTK